MGFVTFIAGATIATGATYGLLKKKEVSHRQQETSVQMNVSLPVGLGLQPSTDIERVAADLERAIDARYFQAVKERIVRKKLLTEREYDVYLLELKRYFILTTMMKRVPMYNEKVDIIWHEMLLFTKSYDAFCTQFMGSKIHHEPNLNPTPNTEEKGLFDFIYTYFFQPHDATRIVYPDLQTQLLSKEFFQALQAKGVDDFIFTYFAPTGNEQFQALRKMIATLQTDVRNAHKLKKRPVYGHSSTAQESYYSSNDYLVNQLMAHSMLDFPEEKTTASTYSSSGSSRSHASDDSSSSSCSSSSCSSSSCGSSCSS